MILALSISILFNIILSISLIAKYESTYSIGEKYIFRDKIIEIEAIHCDYASCSGYGNVSFKVLKKEAIPYTEETWENYLEEKKIKEELKRKI